MKISTNTNHDIKTQINIYLDMKTYINTTIMNTMIMNTYTNPYINTYLDIIDLCLRPQKNVMKWGLRKKRRPQKM